MQDLNDLAKTHYGTSFSELSPEMKEEMTELRTTNLAFAEKYAGNDIVLQHFNKYSEEACLTNAQKDVAVPHFFNGFAAMFTIIGEISGDTDMLQEVMDKLHKELTK